MKAPWICISILLLTALCAAPVLAEDIEQRAAFPDDGRLEVDNVSGSVIIRSWDRQQIEVTGTLESSRDRLEFEVGGRDAIIDIVPSEPRRGDRKHAKQDGEAELLIRVPATTRLIINTVSADITVEGIAAIQRLKSVSGDIDTQLLGSAGELRSVTGDIDIEADGGLERLSVATVSGDAEMSGVSGELDATTVSGDLEIAARQFSRLHVQTVSGDLECEGELQPGGDVEVESVSGTVALRVPSLYDTEFDLQSFSGSIRPVFGHEAKRKNRYAPGYRLRLTEGSGDTRIRINTLSGDIDISATASSRRDPQVVVAGGSRDGGHARDGGFEDLEREMEELARELEKLGDDS